MSSTEQIDGISANNDVENISDVNMMARCPISSTTQTPKTPTSGSAAAMHSVDVIEEIENLYEFIPEVKKLFRIIGKAGEGTFSSVFLAKLRDHPTLREKFALKHINPTSHPDRIEQELRCLLDIGGQANVMGVKLCLRHRDHVVIVMPYVEHDKFQDYVQHLSVCEVREYMKNLLIALKRVHECDIIHRDIKPSNFLYNRASGQFALVDFGLAQKVASLEEDPRKDASTKRVPLKTLSEDNRKNQLDKMTNAKRFSASDSRDRPNFSTSKHLRSPRRFVLAKRMNSSKDKLVDKLSPRSTRSRSENTPGTTCRCFGQPTICRICKSKSNQHAPRAGTPGFRPPEVLLKYPAQTTAVDIWSAGVIFLSLLSGRYPFFRANDDMTALAQIISIMGSKEVTAAAKNLGKTVTLSMTCPAMNLKTMCCKLRRGCAANDKSKICSESWHSAPDRAFDLLAKLLELDPKKRISASDALDHPFFHTGSCFSYGTLTLPLPPPEA